MGRQELAAVVRRWWVPLVLAAILAIVQVTWVLGAYLIPAAYSSLIERTTTISTLLLGYLFFRDERRVIRSGRFLLSGAVAMAAVVGVILFNRDFSAGGRVLVGTLVFVLSSALWAFYAVAIRGMTRGLSAMPTFAVTVAMVSVLLMPLAVHERKMGLMWSSPWNVQLAVVLLGAVCVGVVQVCYYVSLKRIGVAYSSLVGLCTPFLTALFAFLLLGEVLRTGQWLCGAVLVGSLAIMVWNSSGARAKCAEAREDRPHG